MGPAMAVSIMHRVTGNGMATAGALGLVWWLMAAAMGPEAYAIFVACATSPIGYLVMAGLSWFFFQHLCSGLRHLVLDMGAGYEQIGRAHVELQSLMRISYAVFCLKKKKI